jgi:hypothetical protein
MKPPGGVLVAGGTEVSVYLFFNLSMQIGKIEIQ